jgi:hypothetical protein
MSKNWWAEEGLLDSNYLFHAIEEAVAAFHVFFELPHKRMKRLIGVLREESDSILVQL